MCVSHGDQARLEASSPDCAWLPAPAHLWYLSHRDVFSSWIIRTVCVREMCLCVLSMTDRWWCEGQSAVGVGPHSDSVWEETDEEVGEPAPHRPTVSTGLCWWSTTVGAELQWFGFSPCSCYLVWQGEMGKVFVWYLKMVMWRLKILRWQYNIIVIQFGFEEQQDLTDIRLHAPSSEMLLSRFRLEMFVMDMWFYHYYIIFIFTLVSQWDSCTITTMELSGSRHYYVSIHILNGL